MSSERGREYGGEGAGTWWGEGWEVKGVREGGGEKGVREGGLEKGEMECEGEKCV